MPSEEKGAKRYARCDPQKLATLPQQLKSLPQWVCWQAEWKEERGKYSKVPLNPATGREAKSNAPSTWGTFDEALALFTREPTINGIGFEFSSQDPFTFIDLDDARDAETGEVGDWALEIIGKLDSYTEISPSSTGIRIVIKAEAVGASKRRGKCEIYSFGQYATLTGNVFGERREIQERQAELADLYQLIFGAEDPSKHVPRPVLDDTDPKYTRVRAITDDELIAKATAAANGAKFLKLWNAEDITDRSQADASLCSILAYWTRCDLERMDALFRRSRLFRPKWDERRGGDTYGKRTLEFSIKACTAMYDPDMDATVRDGKNDIANTEIFIQLHGSKFIYNPLGKEWFKWNCHRWEPNANLDVLYACEDVSKELVRRTNANPLPDTRAQLAQVKWAVQSGDRRRRDAIENFATTRLKRDGALFNRDPYLLACANGVIDLRTGLLRDGMPGDWITRSTGLSYMPGAPCPVWDQFMSEIMCGDSEMVRYLWRVIGYSLTGDTTERAFFLLHGVGRNGKTTFVETLQALLGTDYGGYAQRARFSTFLRKNVSTGPNDDIAHLSGARVIVASEADDRTPLDTAAIKELTGGDNVRARHLHAKEFEFRPDFKLFLVTNHIPPIHESTHSLWDRLHYIAFDYRIPENKVDRAMRLRLMGELNGILSKAIASCLDWQRDGLAPPEKVLRGRTEIEQTMDTCGQFISEACEIGDANKVSITTKQLYYAFTVWCRESGIQRPPTAKWLVNELRNKKFTEHKIGSVTKWIGLKLQKGGDFNEISEEL